MSYSTSKTEFFDESTDESVIAGKCAKDYVFTMDVEEGFVSKVEEVGSFLDFVFGEKNG
jgi:hypothetical protein